MNIKLKNALLLLMLLLSLPTIVSAQTKKKWKDLTIEEQMMRAQGFQDENLKWLRDTLGFSEERASDVGNVNTCYLASLDRIMRYARTDQEKENFANRVSETRDIELDRIMLGAENKRRYHAYVKARLDQFIKANQ